MAMKFDNRLIMDVAELTDDSRKLLVQVGITTIGQLRVTGHEKLTDLLRGKKGVAEPGMLARDIILIYEKILDQVDITAIGQLLATGQVKPDDRLIMDVAELSRMTKSLLIEVDIRTVSELLETGEVKLVCLLRGKKGVSDPGTLAHDILSICAHK